MLAERGDATDIAVNLTAVISIYQCVDVRIVQDVVLICMLTMCSASRTQLWELDIAYFRPFIGQMVEEM